MKLLLTADLHLGLLSTRIPAEVLAREDRSTNAAWERIVRLALEEAVDVVVLAGDLVDRDNRFFEAYGALEAGVRTLAEAGVDMVAVAGNHDHEVLPRLVDSLDDPHLRFLGRGGTWERTVVEKGGEALAFDGWSFPGPHCDTSPLESYDPEPHETPLVGVLHADLDQGESRYAPVASPELRRTSARLWCVGHVHRPQERSGGTSVLLTPGSPQALDPSETGPRGPWLAEIRGGRVESLQQVALSGVRYETLTLDLSGTSKDTDLQALAARRVRETLHEAVHQSDGALRCLCCRLVLEGRTPLHGALVPGGGEARAANLDDLDELRLDYQEAVAVVDGAPRIRTRPDLDLRELSRGRHPAGKLAQLVLELQEGGGELVDELMPEVLHTLEGTHRAAPYQDLHPEDTGDPRDDPAAGRDEGQARQVLERTAFLLLDELVRRHEDTLA